MDFWDLRCFLTAAEELNFTRAAERLHLSQQALSCRIAKLEAQYQAKLFERSVPLRLTPAGIHMVDWAKSILASKEQMDQEMLYLRERKKQLVRIGVLANRATWLLQSSLLRQTAAASGVEFKIIELFDRAFCTALKTKSVDIGIGFQISSPTLIYEPLLTEEYFLVVPSSIWHIYFSPLQQETILQASSVPLSVFAKCPFVASKQTTCLKDVFEISCRNVGVVPNITAETSSVLTRLALCIAGTGIMVAPTSLLHSLQGLLSQEIQTQLFFIKLSEQPHAPFDTIGINCLLDRYADRSMQAL